MLAFALLSAAPLLTLSTPLPASATTRSLAIDQLVPASVNETVPLEAALLPTRPARLCTWPPWLTVNMPVPASPTVSKPSLGFDIAPRKLTVQEEAVPDTVTVPLPPATPPIVPALLVTWPPFWTLSVPVPPSPAYSVPLAVHRELVSVTVTVPCEPAFSAMKASPLATVPPCSIFRVAAPLKPTVKASARVHRPKTSPLAGKP